MDANKSFELITRNTAEIITEEDLKKKLDAHSEVNWPEYVKQRFEVKIEEFKKFERLKNSGRL